MSHGKHRLAEQPPSAQLDCELLEMSLEELVEKTMEPMGLADYARRELIRRITEEPGLIANIMDMVGFGGIAQCSLVKHYDAFMRGDKPPVPLADKIGKFATSLLSRLRNKVIQ